MKAVITVAFLSLVACSDSTGPQILWLNEGYVLDRIGGQTIPATPGGWGSSQRIWFVEGGVGCPGAKDGFPDQEAHTFRLGYPDNGDRWNVSVAVVCEVEPPNRLKYSYPATGEVIYGSVWEGAGVEKGEFLQIKRLPSREVFLSAIEAQGLSRLSWGWIITKDPEEEAFFRRSH